MKTVSISELKAKLGQIRPPLRRGRLNLELLDLPADPEGRALAALLEERRGNR